MIRYIFAVLVSIAVVVTSVMLLSSCHSQAAADGYFFEHKDYTQTELVLNVIEHKNQTDLEAAYAKVGHPLPDGRTLAAFSTINRTGNQELCTMHIIDPAVSYQPEFIGHELTHCIYGQFHPTQP